MDQIQIAQQQFGELIKSELERIERMKLDTEIKDFSKLDTITVGILPGDGVGPILMKQALRVLEDLMAPEIASGRLVIRQIEGMTIERRADLMQSLPDDVFQACKECDVLVKGPMVTPREGDPWPNLVSANSLLRRGLDLFAAVRPIRMPDKGIDWTFFRENIEGEYILGNRGIQVNEDLAIDFKVATRQGCERIGRAALDFCRKNGKKSLTIITKANIVKLVDGNFIKHITEVAEREYPEVTVGTRFVDAMAAKMMDPGFNEGMEVFVLPNLYGDIVTDVAAEHQGGLGTASSSNIGNRYALFEAIHGTAPRLIARGCGDYADPCSLIRAMGMMMAHIGYADRKQLLEKALDICTITERKLVVTRRKEDASAEEFTTYLLETVDRLRNEQ